MSSSKQADAAGDLLTFQSKLTSFQRRPHRRSDGLRSAVLGGPMHDAEGLYSVAVYGDLRSHWAAAAMWRVMSCPTRFGSASQGT